MQTKQLPWPWNVLLSPKSRGIIGLADDAIKRHALVVGLPGVGKSILLSFLAVLIALRRVTGHSKGGVCVIDITSDLYNTVRARLAILAGRFPSLYKLVILIDPSNPQWSVRYNPLEFPPSATSREERMKLAKRKAKALASLIIAVGKDDPSIVVRMKRVAYYTFLALSMSGGSLVDVSRFLTDRPYRANMVNTIRDEELSRFWFSSFPKGERDAREMTESLLNRIEPLTTNDDLAFMLHGPSTIDFREMLDQGMIVLVNAPKSSNKLGEEGSYLLCAFLVSAFENAAYTRDELPDSERVLFTLIGDEFTHYVTDATIRIVMLLRKCALGLVLATQTLQGNPKTEAIINLALQTVDNIMSFRVSHGDAEILAQELFSPSVDQVKDLRYRGLLNHERVWRPLPEIDRQTLTQIKNLPDRQFWYKRRGHSGVHLIKTLPIADVKDLPDASRLPKLLKIQEQAAFKLAGVSKQNTRGSDNHRPAEQQTHTEPIDEAYYDPLE